MGLDCLYTGSFNSFISVFSESGFKMKKKKFNGRQRNKNCFIKKLMKYTQAEIFHWYQLKGKLIWILLEIFTILLYILVKW